MNEKKENNKKETEKQEKNKNQTKQKKTKTNTESLGSTQSRHWKTEKKKQKEEKISLPDPAVPLNFQLMVTFCIVYKTSLFHPEDI